ncbi:hypothetical protein BZA77DRAFT_146035 [Pyronema omphalodes]|nr:hypothetical protein BZA77DRAFT_146035 [Pyronema omphalodes]
MTPVISSHQTYPTTSGFLYPVSDGQSPDFDITRAHSFCPAGYLECSQDRLESSLHSDCCPHGYECSVPSPACIPSKVMGEVMSEKINSAGLRRKARQWTGDWQLDSFTAQPKTLQKVPADQPMSKQSEITPTSTPSQSQSQSSSLKVRIPFPSPSATTANAAPDIAPPVTIVNTPTQQTSMATVRTAEREITTASSRKSSDASEKTDVMVARVAGAIIIGCILIGGLLLYVRRLWKNSETKGAYGTKGGNVKDLEDGDTLALAELASPIAVVTELPASNPREVRSAWSIRSSKQQQAGAIDTCNVK